MACPPSRQSTAESEAVLARQVKPDEHAARRREIFDAALQLIHDKGYDRMTIEDLLSRLQIS
ncbi:MAG: TetR family transcriptional regulator, partial [Mycobacterium sp.]